MADRTEARHRFVEAAIDLLQQGDADERATAASVIGKLGEKDYIPALIASLQDDDSRQVKHKVSQAIARIGGAEAVSELQNIMTEADQYTRFLAAEALADILSNGRAE